MTAQSVTLGPCECGHSLDYLFTDHFELGGSERFDLVLESFKDGVSGQALARAIKGEKCGPGRNNLKGPRRSRITKAKDLVRPRDGEFFVDRETPDLAWYTPRTRRINCGGKETFNTGSTLAALLRSIDRVFGDYHFEPRHYLTSKLTWTSKCHTVAELSRHEIFGPLPCVVFSQAGLSRQDHNSRRLGGDGELALSHFNAVEPGERGMVDLRFDSIDDREETVFGTEYRTNCHSASLPEHRRLAKPCHTKRVAIGRLSVFRDMRLAASAAGYA